MTVWHSSDDDVCEVLGGGGFGEDNRVVAVVAVAVHDVARDHFVFGVLFYQSHYHDGF